MPTWFAGKNDCLAEFTSDMGLEEGIQREAVAPVPALLLFNPCTGPTTAGNLMQAACTPQLAGICASSIETKVWAGSHTDSAASAGSPFISIDARSAGCHGASASAAASANSSVTSAEDAAPAVGLGAHL